jgi:large-conductance mechanosensitive channel
LNEGNFRFWSLIIAIIFLILGILNSKILTPLNKIWIKFGLFLGSIISPIIMSIIFFFVITPISFVMKVLGKDILNLKRNNNNTYWIDKSGPKSKMKNQF